jgi:predicted RNA-binding protein with PIN domain
VSPSALPIHDDLLLPVLDAAADTLRAMESADVPLALRHVHGFEKRGLLAGPGRRQLRRALELDDHFRTLTIERFCDRPEVAAIASGWSPEDAIGCVDAADARRDLPLLASMLWAKQPPGAQFGLGLAVARSELARQARDDADASRVQERELAEIEEARRRAEAARMDAEAELARITGELQRERGSRRSREEEADAAATAVTAELDRTREEFERLGAELDDAEMRVARESKRAHALENDVKKLRAELDEALAKSKRTDVVDAGAIADVAANAERVASSLRSLERRVREQRAPTERVSEASDARRVAPPAGRAAPAVPAGVVADSAAGVEAMLRTPDTLLVVDGYNVTKRAWPDATAADQRERLGIAITALHRRIGCGVLIVFDGDGSRASRPPLRRGGVRVVFSDAAEEADQVVVREVSELPKRIPVVVVSSDAWVRGHAEAQGAVVVGADALLRMFRPAR